MADIQEDNHIKNSTWLTAFFVVSTILVGLMSFWFLSSLTNNEDGPFQITFAEENDDTPPSSVGVDLPVVQVANATSEDGLAGEVTRRLQSSDFVGLAPFDVDGFDQSVVYYKTDGLLRQQTAEQIAEKFAVSVVEPLPDDLDVDGLDPEAEFFFIVGSDADLG